MRAHARPVVDAHRPRGPGRRLPLLLGLHRRQDPEPRRRAEDARARAQRRLELPPHEPLGPLRPPLRGHLGRGPADRPGAGRAVRLPPRVHVDPVRRRPRRRGAGLRDPGRLGAARGTVARRDRARGARPRARHRHGRRHPLHRRGRPRRPRARGRRGARRVGVGGVHHRAQRSDRARDGALHLPRLQGQRGGHPARHGRGRRAPRRRALRRQGHRRRPPRRGAPPEQAIADLHHRRLRLPRQRAPRLDAPLPAGLPVELPQDRHHLHARRGHHDREPRGRDAALHRASARRA